jgi:sn-glycerol 3-phosphate transport system permease protein
MVPALGLLAVFAYRPVARSVQLSLYGSDLLGRPSRFVGLEHYRALLGEPALRRALFVTLTVTLLSTALATGEALAAALPLRWVGRRARGVATTILSLPFAYSSAAASAVFAGLFAPAVGTLNEVLAAVGLPGPQWLESPGWAMVAITLTTAWYEFGFALLVLVAAISTLEESVVEAAALDGAGPWRTSVSVLMPMLRPSLLFLVVTQTISGLQIFTQVQVLTRGGPAGSTSTLVYELYRRAFGDGLPDYGSASTVALVLMALVLLVTALTFRWNRRTA